MSDLYLSLDLEMEQPSEEIIQIGACIGNIKTGEILDTFCAYVAPEFPLSPFITQLTGITQKTIDEEGKDILAAYKSLLEFVKPHDINCNVMTWGGGDTKELKNQVQWAYDVVVIGKVFAWPFGRRWIDIKTWFQFRQLARGEKLQAGLAKAMAKTGLNFKGRKHDALADSVNTFRLAHQLVTEYKGILT